MQCYDKSEVVWHNESLSFCLLCSVRIFCFAQPGWHRTLFPCFGSSRDLLSVTFVWTNLSEHGIQDCAQPNGGPGMVWASSTCVSRLTLHYPFYKPALWLMLLFILVQYKLTRHLAVLGWPFLSFFCIHVSRLGKVVANPKKKASTSSFKDWVGLWSACFLYFSRIFFCSKTWCVEQRKGKVLLLSLYYVSGFQLVIFCSSPKLWLQAKIMATARFTLNGAPLQKLYATPTRTRAVQQAAVAELTVQTDTRMLCG